MEVLRVLLAGHRDRRIGFAREHAQARAIDDGIVEPRDDDLARGRIHQVDDLSISPARLIFVALRFDGPQRIDHVSPDHDLLGPGEPTLEVALGVVLLVLGGNVEHRRALHFVARFLDLLADLDLPPHAVHVLGMCRRRAAGRRGRATPASPGGGATGAGSPRSPGGVARGAPRARRPAGRRARCWRRRPHGGTVAGSRPRATSVESPFGGTKATVRIRGSSGAWSAQTSSSSCPQTTSPPNRAGATLSGCPSRSSARARQSRRVRAGRPRRRRAHGRGRCHRRSPPRTSRGHGRAGSGWCTRAGAAAVGTSIAPKAASIARATRWVASSGTVADALAGHLDHEPVAADLGGQLVAQLERQPEAVVAGTEVGAGRRDRDRDRAREEGHRSPAAAAACSTSGSMTASTSSPADSSAVAVSFSPWPVTVITTVSPA